MAPFLWPVTKIIYSPLLCISTSKQVLHMLFKSSFQHLTSYFPQPRQPLGVNSCLKVPPGEWRGLAVSIVSLDLLLVKNIQQSSSKAVNGGRKASANLTAPYKNKLFTQF